MKLLTKQETNFESTMQRKSEIDNGMYLAARVDKLRKTLTELEMQQKSFIENNRKVIEDSLKELNDRKSALRDEIKSLEDKRQEMMVPLTEEWKDVDNVKEEVNSLYKSLKEKEVIYEQKIQETEDHLNKAKQDSIASDKDNELAQEKLSDIHSRLQGIATRERALESYDESVRAESENKLKLIEMKERKLSYDIKHYEDFTKELKQREKKLAQRETKLNLYEIRN